MIKARAATGPPRSPLAARRRRHLVDAAVLHHIRARTLVLAGDDDPLLPVLNARVLAWRIPHAELRVLEGGGHLVVLDSVDEVAPILTRFLAC